MHLTLAENRKLFPNSDFAAGLRVLNFNNYKSLLIDQTEGFVPSPIRQQETAEHCFRFINSDMFYAKRDVSALVEGMF